MTSIPYEIKARHSNRVIWSGTIEVFDYEPNRVRLGRAVLAALKEGADLWGAELRGAELRGAELRGADLWGANLWGANLWGANLWGADLRDANLWGADLRGADLWGANLWGADLRGANLRGANLRDVDLWGNIRLNWHSHLLLAEVLRREAGGDPMRRAMAGMIALSADWCWDALAERAEEVVAAGLPFAWAVGVLAGHPDAENAPAQLSALAEQWLSTETA